jgi:hypothetical protein
MTTTQWKTHRIRTGLVVTGLLAIGAVGLAGCGGGDSPSSSGTTRDVATIVTGTNDGATLGAADASAIAFMREEEKLARDVYTVLGDQWAVPTFTNIAASEQQHMDAVATLIDRYGLEDPAADTAIGEFEDPDLQALYDQLIAQGSTSLEDALQVGVLIEETDIADLAARASDNPVVQRVWDRLTAGSENHLRAFQSALDRRAA